MPQVSFKDKIMSSYVNIAAQSHGIDVANYKPDQLIGLTTKDEVLGEVVNTATHGDHQLKLEFHRAVIEYANQHHDERNSFLSPEPDLFPNVDEERVISDRGNEVVPGEVVARFHRELVKHMPDDLDQTVLDDRDIEKIVSESKELGKYVDEATGNNMDLARSLFTQTVRFIEQQDYAGFEEQPTFGERLDNFQPDYKPKNQ